MEPEEGGALRLGSTTPDMGVIGPLCEGLSEGMATMVTTKDAVTALTTGAEEATQMVGIVRTDVTLLIWGVKNPKVEVTVRDHMELVRGD